MTPELKTFHTASASQVKTWRGCNRKWWYDKILGLGQPTTAAMDFGTKVHAQLEDYVNGKIEVGQMMPEAIELLQYLPQNHHLITEQKLTIPKGDGWPVQVTGLIDLLAQDKESPELIHVIDYKTTGNFAYVPEREVVKADPQRVIYTAMVFHFEKKAEHVTFQLLYTLKTYNRTEPQSKQVAASTKRGDADFRQVLLDLKADLHFMVADAAKQNAEDVTPNYDDCGSYGGCPFKDRCPGACGDQKTGTEYYMGLFDKADGPGINPPAVNQPATPSPLAGFNPQQATQPSAVATQQPLPRWTQQPAQEDDKPKRKRRTKAEIERDTLIEQANGNFDSLSPQDYGKLSYLLSENPIEGFTLPAQGTAAPVQQQPVAQTAAPVQQPVQQTAAPVQQPVQQTAAPVQQPVQQPVHAVKEPSGLRLFVNCRPEGVPCADLNTLLRPIFEKIEADNKVAYWTQVEYGKGIDAAAGLLNLCFDPGYQKDREALALFGNIYADGRDTAFAKLINVLRRHADLVVTG